jgi:DNA ligase 1
MKGSNMYTKTWPTLYKKNSNGSIQEWTISVIDNDGEKTDVYIQKEYGQMGGAIQTSDPDYIKGKNVGKANETTPWDQACREAEAQWTKKKTGGKGYVESIDDAEEGKKDELVTGGADVMLAKSYGIIVNDEFTPDAAKKVKFPCFAQPKLNGHRCVAVISDGKCTLWTRTRKPIVSMPHIVEALESLFTTRTIVLDGELYNHDYNEHLEDLSSLIRPEYVKEGSEIVQYHMYDVISPNGTQKARQDILREWASRNTNDRLQFVETLIISDHDMLVTMFNSWRVDGYEGAIVRNVDAEYEGKRSWNLQKLKGWMSKEFKIIDVKEGRGKMAGKAVLRCETGADDPIPGVQFDCSLAASMERRAEIFENKDDYIGKLVSVKFAYYTQEGVPFHLVGEAIRDYE